MDDEEMFIDDLEYIKKKRKGVNSGRKGKRCERSLVDLLTERFGAGFSRSVGSGNRWSQVSSMPKHAQDTFSGDIVCPEDFLWVFECKGGYKDIDLNGTFVGGNSELDGFLVQAREESDRAGRKAMLCWKKDRKPWLAFVQTKDVAKRFECEYQMKYRDWTVAALVEFLKLPDEYWRIT